MSEDRDSYYRALEQQVLTYKELSTITVEENGSPMVSLAKTFSGRIFVSDERMKAFTGEDIYVRAELVPMLEKARETLKTIWPDCDLQVVYGYRHLDIQIAKFEAHKARVLERFPSLSGDELYETIHRFSAVPEVAGHPTGGAVDICIVDKDGERVDTGTAVVEYSDDTYVFSPFISRTAWRNRQILRACMIRAGFAPFDGEWWHFSYGDREWAFYYSQPKAFFTQLRFKSVDD
ncbi:M15 family metallopeptidase [Breoghania sp.]|uniref:M15 family metallopeptidase n=1 Tax=Breoghania sp. TaxID=2065378 RepID=UPI002AA73D42|nr:M15 family metallopeptidase [Breoghania sp.]